MHRIVLGKERILVVLNPPDIKQPATVELGFGVPVSVVEKKRVPLSVVWIKW